MNLLRRSITTILQHRTHGCSNGCPSLACAILYMMKKHPLLIFLRCGWNNLNSYNSKTHVIRTSSESPWGFELYEFNCSTFFITRFFVVFICFERSCCFFWGGVLNGRRFYWLHSTTMSLYSTFATLVPLLDLSILVSLRVCNTPFHLFHKIVNNCVYSFSGQV